MLIFPSPKGKEERLIDEAGVALAIGETAGIGEITGEAVVTGDTVDEVAGAANPDELPPQPLIMVHEQINAKKR